MTQRSEVCRDSSHRWSLIPSVRMSAAVCARPALPAFSRRR